MKKLRVPITFAQPPNARPLRPVSFLHVVDIQKLLSSLKKFLGTLINILPIATRKNA